MLMYIAGDLGPTLTCLFNAVFYMLICPCVYVCLHTNLVVAKSIAVFL